MSLQGLLRELDRTKTAELEKKMQLLREQHAADLESKEKEIASLREEIGTLRRWLDHSALPAFNPISERKDAMGLVKMNFSPDKPAPEMWSPGEKELLASVERRPAIAQDSPEEAVPQDDYFLEEPLPRGPIPEAPRFEPPSSDLSHRERPEPPAELSLEEPAIPEFSLPELELPGPGLSGLNADPVTSPRKASAGKPSKKGADAPKPVRKISFPSVRKATRPRRKARAAGVKTK